MNKTLSLFLAGAAAYGYYKFSKMSDTQRKDLVNNLKDKGKKLYDQYVPSNLKSQLEKTV